MNTENSVLFDFLSQSDTSIFFLAILWYNFIASAAASYGFLYFLAPKVHKTMPTGTILELVYEPLQLYAVVPGTTTPFSGTMCSLHPCELAQLKSTFDTCSPEQHVGNRSGNRPGWAKPGKEHAARLAAHSWKAVQQSTVTTDSRPSLSSLLICGIRGFPLLGMLLLQQMLRSWSSLLKIKPLVTFVPLHTRPADLTYCFPKRQNSAFG